MTDLNYYVKKFRKLRSDRNANWPDATLNRSPYKPLLLLSVMDLFAQGRITLNLVELSSDLGELFDLYCLQVLPSDSRWNIAMPFFHLCSEGFWHLSPLPGKEATVASGRQLRSITLLNETVQGVCLDEELYALLCVEESRNVLRTVLIETYFASDTQEALVKQGIINSEAFEYSQFLLSRARQAAKEETVIEKEYQQPVRDQGFRRAVVTAYNHRCAFCGIRMITPRGHTAVAAAHIIPWSVSHNDDPRNGLALCHLCHWTFDEGLVGVTPKYVVVSSPQLMANQNIPGYLTTLDRREMIGPDERELWPDITSLKWHLDKVFLKH